MKIQKTVIDETIKVAIGELIGVVLMFLVWALIHKYSPSISFDHRVILGGLIGGVVAVGNFLLLGISVQKLAEIKDEETSRKFFKSSYRKRMLMLIVWGILGFALPCFNGVAGVIPLLFPTITIKAVGVVDAVKGLNKDSASIKKEQDNRDLINHDSATDDKSNMDLQNSKSENE